MAQHHRFIKALHKQPVDKTPIWIMRQAGRYLPEYRKLRSQVNGFLELCKTPELACEVTLQPLARFDLDAAILFSDILTIPDAMNLGLHFVESEGPKFSNPLRDEKSILNLDVITPYENLNYVFEAIKLIKHELADKLPLIGFAGSPWTLATYMIEGGSSKNFAIAKAMLYQRPDLLHHLLQVLADSTVHYLKSQIAAGVDAVMIFDTWGGILSTKAYQEFSLTYMQYILKQLPADIPSILFTKGGNLWLEQIAAANCHCVGIDWTIDMEVAKQRIGQKVAIQGNLDPCILYAKPEIIRQQAQKILQVFDNEPGHIFNLGHGIYPNTPITSVEVLVDIVHKG